MSIIYFYDMMYYLDLELNMKHLLLIDCQKDFCDPNGSLYVPGANKDMDRISQYIFKNGHLINKITVSLDFHRLLHIAHPDFWKDSKGNPPPPFTIITLEQIQNKKWIPLFFTKALNYVRKLEENGRYNLCIWPPHCLIGDEGANLVPSVHDALLEWERKYHDITYLTKGQNIFTEHYSIIKAEVPDEEDETTLPNLDLLERIEQSANLLVAGEASSHCVSNTVYDIVSHLGEDFKNKIILLKNGMSPVPGYEYLQEKLFTDFKTTLNL
jgi:nicotinamidase/pyrazinamidase